RLVVAEPDDVDDARAAVAVLALDDAGVRHLAAPRRVERRLDELGQDAAVGAVDRLDRGRLRRPLVAGERRRRARVRERADPIALDVLAAAPSARPRPGALVLHQVLEARGVDAEPLLRRELDGQPEREAVRVMELERLLRADPL